MKITKEKVIYFLSLNLVPSLFLILFMTFLFFVLPRCAHRGTVCVLNTNAFLNLLRMTFYLWFFAILPMSLISFIYVLIKKEKFNFLFASVFISLISIFLMLILLIFNNFKANFGFDGLISVIFYIFISSISSFFLLFIFNIIILKITDPLRRKIKW